MRTWKNSLLGSLSLALLVLVTAGPACTRSSSSSQASIQLQLPTAEALKNSQSAHAKDIVTTGNSVYHVVVLNVTASDIPQPVFYQWLNNNDDTSLTPPTTVTLSVPQGSSRLVQALVLLDDSSTQTSTIYYGHATVTLAAGANTVSLDLTAEPGAKAINSNGNIVGRYIRADGSTPTGHVSVFYHSINYAGDPLMLLDNSTEIIAGWFKTFGMGFDSGSTTNGLIYQMDDGTPLFTTTNGNRVDLNHLTSGQDLGTLTSSALAVEIPASCKSYDSGATFDDCNPALTTVYGLFGPKVEATNSNGSLTPYQVCYISTTAAPIPDLYAADSGHAQLDWYGSTSQIGVVYESGGVFGGQDSNGYCQPSAQMGITNAKFNTYLSFNYNLAGSSNMALGFEGPFRRIDSLIPASSTTSTLYSTYSYTSGTGTLNVNWQLLPGTPSVISGVDLFVRAGTSDDDVKANNGYDCGSLVKNGFQNVASVTTTSDDTLTYTATATLSGTLASDISTGGTLIACPYTTTSMGSTKVYFVSAVDSQIGGTVPQSTGSGGVVVAAPGQTASAGTLGGFALPVYAGTPVTLTLTPFDTTNNAYTTYNLNSNSMLTLTNATAASYVGPINPISGSNPPWSEVITFTSPMAVSGSLFSQLAGLTLSTTSAAFSVYSNPLTPEQITFFQPSNASATTASGQCQPILFQMTNQFNVGSNYFYSAASPPATPVPVTNVQSFFHLYILPDCTDEVTSSSSYAFGSTDTLLYLSAAATYGSALNPSPSTTGLNVYGNSSSPNTLPTSASVSAASQYQLLGPQYFLTENCQAFAIAQMDANGYSSPSADTVTISASDGSSIFYDNPSCTGSSSTSLSYTFTSSPYSRASLTYVKVSHSLANPTYTFNLMMTSTNGLSTPTIPMSVLYFNPNND